MLSGTEPPFTCVTCEVEIHGTPVFGVGLPFCCGGCVAGGPCICSYDRDAFGQDVVRHCLDVSELIGASRD